MLYEATAGDDAIRQGDLFVGVPRMEADFANLPVASDQQLKAVEWQETGEQGSEGVQALVNVRSVIAVVITQDCDAIRAPDISLCEALPIAVVEGQAQNATTAKAWVKILTRQARMNLKWFYLPPDDTYGLTERMAVDFRQTFSVPRVYLEGLKQSRRVGRINSYARAHLRERLSDFFRRYPYDEWYNLNAAELKEYRAAYPDAEPFPWQDAAPPEA